MRPHLCSSLWAILVLPILASTIPSFPTAVELSIAPPERDLVRRDVDHDESFKWSETQKPIIDIHLKLNELEVNCTECNLSGSVHTHYDEKTIEFWESDLNISLSKTSAHIDLSILAGSGGEHVVPLWNVRGINIAGVQANLGLGFYIELVFTLEGELQATGGFEFTIPDGSWIAVNLNGDLIGANFDGSDSTLLPWDVTSGSTTLKVSLRLRTELGVSTNIILVGTDAAVGVYLNLLEFVVKFEADEGDKTCALEAIEYWDINAGAYAKLDVDLDHITLGVAPTKSTTLFSGPTITNCIEQASLTSAASSTVHTLGPGSSSGPSQSLHTAVASSSNAIQSQTCDESEDSTTTSVPRAVSTVYRTSTHSVTDQAVVTVTRTVDQYTTICPEANLKSYS